MGRDQNTAVRKGNDHRALSTTLGTQTPSGRHSRQHGDTFSSRTPKHPQQPHLLFPTFPIISQWNIILRSNLALWSDQPWYPCCCYLVAKSCLTLATPWTVAHQAPLSMGFSKKEYWLIFPSPGDLPNPGIEPVSSAWQANSLLVRHLGNLTLIALPHFIKSQHRHKTRLPIDSQPCSLVAGREEVGFIFSPMGWTHQFSSFTFRSFVYGHM